MTQLNVKELERNDLMMVETTVIAHLSFCSTSNLEVQIKVSFKCQLLTQFCTSHQ